MRRRANECCSIDCFLLGLCLEFTFASQRQHTVGTQSILLIINFSQSYLEYYEIDGRFDISASLTLTCASFHMSAAEAQRLLQNVEDCLNEVYSRLEQQKNSRYVTRFPEKNLLTHKCTNAFDKWRRSHQEWMAKTCHEAPDSESCRALQQLLTEKVLDLLSSTLSRSISDPIG